MAKKIILVTGGAGHVGSHVIEELLEDPNNQVTLKALSTVKVTQKILKI
jgi:nucleoside-diphosphate-sugar epimerase